MGPRKFQGNRSVGEILFHLARMIAITLPETNSSHLKMDGWNTSFLLGWPIFRGEMLVSGRVTATCFPGKFPHLQTGGPQ